MNQSQCAALHHDRLNNNLPSLPPPPTRPMSALTINTQVPDPDADLDNRLKDDPFLDHKILSDQSKPYSKSHFSPLSPENVADDWNFSSQYEDLVNQERQRLEAQILAESDSDSQQGASKHVCVDKVTNMNDDITANRSINNNLNTDNTSHANDNQREPSTPSISPPPPFTQSNTEEVNNIQNYHPHHAVKLDLLNTPHSQPPLHHSTPSAPSPSPSHLSACSPFSTPSSPLFYSPNSGCATPSSIIHDLPRLPYPTSDLPRLPYPTSDPTTASTQNNTDYNNKITSSIHSSYRSHGSNSPYGRSYSASDCSNSSSSSGSSSGSDSDFAGYQHKKLHAARRRYTTDASRDVIITDVRVHKVKVTIVESCSNQGFFKDADVR